VLTGDIIIGFSTDVGLNPEDIPLADLATYDVWTELLAPMPPDDLVSLRVFSPMSEDERVVELPARDLYVGLRGYSLVLDVTLGLYDTSPGAFASDTLEAVNAASYAVVQPQIGAFLADPEAWDFGRTPAELEDMHPLENYDLLPLKKLIDQGKNALPSSQPDIIAVASAGNFGSDGTKYPDQPLIPGYWANTIGVSGSLWNTTSERYEYFNSGEVMAPGAWYKMPAGRVSLYLAGTSFSAPMAAVLTAGAAAAPDTCTLDPILAYKNTQTFDNVEFISVMEQACPAQ
jgi:hypothetical protein